MRVIIVYIIVFSFAVIGNAKAQCCAMGSPFNNTTAIGVMEKGRLQAGLTYKHGYFETYFRNRIRLINYGMYRELSYDYLALNISYGVSDRFSIEHEAGYFLSKAARFADPELDAWANKGQGFSNGLLLARYAFLVVPAKRFSLDAGAGFKYPFAMQSQSVGGVELPPEAQPSTGAFGGLFQLQASKSFRDFNMTLQHRYDFNTTNYDNYKYGDAHITTVSIAREISQTFTGVLMMRHELRGSDTAPNHSLLASEGSRLVILAPQLGVKAFRNLSISVFGDIPVYRYYFGEQISQRYAFGMSLVWNTSLARPLPGASGFEIIDGE